MSERTRDGVTRDTLPAAGQRYGIATALGALRYVLDDAKNELVSVNETNGIRLRNPDQRPIPDWVRADVKANTESAAGSLIDEDLKKTDSFSDTWTAGWFDRLTVSLMSGRFDERHSATKAVLFTIWDLWEKVEGGFVEVDGKVEWKFQTQPWRSILRTEDLERVNALYSVAMSDARVMVGEELAWAVKEIMGKPAQDDRRTASRPKVDIDALDRDLPPQTAPPSEQEAPVKPEEPTQVGLFDESKLDTRTGTVGDLPPVFSRGIDLHGESGSTAAADAPKIGPAPQTDSQKSPGGRISLSALD